LGLDDQDKQQQQISDEDILLTSSSIFPTQQPSTENPREEGI
jgi:hypothetical protein